jgi:hypothetical protein
MAFTTEKLFPIECVNPMLNGGLVSDGRDVIFT